MPGVTIVTGKLGGGKSIVSVSRIKDYMERGRPIATNLNLFLHHMCKKSSRGVNVIRVPDKPSIDDLNAIGYGNTTYDESLNGLLVLDECGTWFNARNWSDKTRKPVNDWFLHARKLGWDVILIVQDISILDSQAQAAIAEHTAFCKRLDRISVPYLGTLYRFFTGKQLKGPKVHIGRVVYGTTIKDLVSERWVYRGVDLYRAYDTKQMFKDRSPGIPQTKKIFWTTVDPDTGEEQQWSKEVQVQTDMAPDYFGAHCLLTPWHLYGRYQKPLDKERIMRLTKIHLKRFNGPMTVAAGVILGFLCSVASLPYFINKVREAGNAEVVANVLSAGETATANVGADSPASVRSNVDVVSTDPDVVSTVAAQFVGYSIAAHMANEGSRYYLVSAPGFPAFTDKQLESMGYRVFPVSECELMVTAADNFADKANLFLPGCVPKRHNRVAADLTQFPTLAAKTVPLMPTQSADSLLAQVQNQGASHGSAGQSPQVATVAQ